MLEWLSEHYKEFGTTLEIITDKSQEGSQFVKGFGGLGGALIANRQGGGLVRGWGGRKRKSEEKSKEKSEEKSKEKSKEKNWHTRMHTRTHTHAQ